MSLEQQEMNDEKFARLSGYLDGELTQQEAQKVSLLIETDPEYQVLYKELNAELAEIWPVQTEVKPAMDEAEKWNGVPNKLDMLEK